MLRGERQCKCSEHSRVAQRKSQRPLMEDVNYEACIHSERVEYFSDVFVCMYKDLWLRIWLDFVCFSKSFLRIALVENIPEGLNYSENAPFHLSLFQGWMNLLNMATKSVDIVSSHWDLNHSHPSACQVSCILYVCDDFTCVHFTLFSILVLHSSSSSSLF